MHKLLFTAVGLLVLTNVVVLSGVAYNRSGEPRASLELTERELPLRQFYVSRDENSGTALNLQWRVLAKDSGDEARILYDNYSAPAWLDESKLTELGFDLAKLKSNAEKDSYDLELNTAEAVLVLEYQGAAYKQDLARIGRRVNQLKEQKKDSPKDANLQRQFERFSEELTRLKLSRTRLYVIDAGLDEEALAQKYSDRKKYLFVRGEIGINWDHDDVVGRVRRLFVSQVHVPLPFSRQLTSITKGKKYYSYGAQPIAPRYRVALNMGKRFEPWIVSITSIKVQP